MKGITREVQNRVLRRIYGSRGSDKRLEKDCIVRSFIICIPYHILE
jgi:hypothetical protein